ncbi:hypothetical protein ACFQL3_06245 [Natronoarchaeum sp. GCM10025321]|uniref:hypothetical protein n=1 Tax=Natronoarchaeum sp. GCM10025321 TaxID=3252684 RepID=UPI0036122BB6
MEPSRRRVLAGTTGLLTASVLAGCLDEAEGANGDENDAKGNGTDDTPTASVTFLFEGADGHNHDEEDEHEEEDDHQNEDTVESVVLFARGGSANIIEGDLEHADAAENCNLIDQYVVELDDGHAVMEFRAD